MSATTTVTLTPTGGAIPSTLAPIIKGETGPAGAASTVPGPAGPGVPTGGTTGQVLAKASNADHDTEWVAQTGGSGGGATNLAYTASPTNGTVTSDTGTDATLPLADATNAGLQSPAQYTKLAGIAAGATAVTVDATPTNGSGNAVSSDGVFDALAGKSDTGHAHTGTYQPLATVLTNTTASFTAAQETKLGNITVTQAVDLDDIETRVNALDAAVILKGTWDASAGTFPGAGAAQAGWSYIVSIAGTVDGTAFAVGDRAIAILDNASTTTYAANWFKADYTDQVLSVHGRAGAVVAQSGDYTSDQVTEGSTNLYHTAARVRSALLTGLSTAAGTVVAATHTVLEAIGFLQKQVSDNATAILEAFGFLQEQVSDNATAIAGKAATGAIGSSGLTQSTGKLLGRSTAGTGAVEEITVGSGLTLSAGTLTAAGGTPGGIAGDMQYSDGSAFQGSPLKRTSATVLDMHNGAGASDMKIRISANRIDNANYTALVIATTGGGYGQIYPEKVGSGTGTGSLDIGGDGGGANLIRFGGSNAQIYGLNLRPGSDFGVDLGSSSRRFGAIYTKNLIGTGNLATGIAAKTANYTATANDGSIECDATGGAITITLPAASGTGGRIFAIKKTDSSGNAVTIDANASETIDGATTISLASQYSTAIIQCNTAGTAWLKLASI